MRDCGLTPPTSILGWAEKQAYPRAKGDRGLQVVGSRVHLPRGLWLKREDEDMGHEGNWQTSSGTVLQGGA